MSRPTLDGTAAEPVPRDQILRHKRGQANIIFPCSAAHEEQDCQPYPVDPSLAIICDGYTYIRTTVTKSRSTNCQVPGRTRRGYVVSAGMCKCYN